MKFIYLFTYLLFVTTLFSCYTCPPMPTCSSDDDCNGDTACINHYCEENPCLDVDCGKGECIINRNTLYENYQNGDGQKEIKAFYCECEDTAVLYNNVCSPKCNSFSEECRNFNLKNKYDYSQQHECNVELGHCDYICKGDNSCEEGYVCVDSGKCKQLCSMDSDCKTNEICFNSKDLDYSYCEENPCNNYDCGNGTCNPHKVFSEELGRETLCQCNEDNVLFASGYYDILDICVPKCDSFTYKCRNFNHKGIRECNMDLGHCDKYCQGEGSCGVGYRCTYRGKCEYICKGDNRCEAGYICLDRGCTKLCTRDSDCESKEYCFSDDNLNYSYCKKNPCNNYDCGNGTCNPHKVFSEELGRETLCQCDEDNVLVHFEHDLGFDMCVPRCNSFSSICRSFNHGYISECNIEKGHCDKYCQGEGSCGGLYRCNSRGYCVSASW